MRYFILMLLMIVLAPACLQAEVPPPGPFKFREKGELPRWMIEPTPDKYRGQNDFASWYEFSTEDGDFIFTIAELSWPGVNLVFVEHDDQLVDWGFTFPGAPVITTYYGSGDGIVQFVLGTPDDDIIQLDSSNVASDAFLLVVGLGGDDIIFSSTDVDTLIDAGPGDDIVDTGDGVTKFFADRAATTSILGAAWTASSARAATM